MIEDNDLEEHKSKLVFEMLNSAEELREWMSLYFGIYFPMGVVHPDSTHSPTEAMWRIYQLMKTGESENVPQVCMLSARDSYKTLSAAAIEVLCMIHFRISVAHMAAIDSQSQKAVQYVELFFRKIGKYLEYNNWKKSSNNKRMIEWITEDGRNIYLKIIIATIAGANCIDPESIIHTRDGEKRAYQINRNEEVLTRDFINNKDIYVKIYSTSWTKKESLLIEFSDGSDLIVSTDHKVFTHKGWITADQLKIGTKVIPLDQNKPINTDYNLDIIEHGDWSLEQLLLGTLLGDSSLYRTPAGSYRYQTSHCAAQLPYLNHLKNILALNGIVSNIIPDKKNQFKLTSLTSEAFKEYAELCYSESKKQVTEKWLNRLNLEGWAYFLMDDGTNHSKVYGKRKEENISFATCGFSLHENQLIINNLISDGYEAYIKTVSNSSKKKYNTVELNKKSGRVFSSNINKWVIPSLKYKLLTPENHLTLRHYIDTGKIINTYNLMGLKWENTSDFNQRKIRKVINSQLLNKVVSITPIGVRNLIDLHIDNDNYNLQSFYANNTLVHNSEHVPMLFIDEVDIVQNPKALEEAKMIPSVFGKYFPMTVYLSTRKFAGGLMEKTLKQTIAAGGEVLRWNILDITERISVETARIDEPKVVRYLGRGLPMINLTESEWAALSDEHRNDYERFEAYAGIAEHPLLPVMRNYLVDRNQDDVGYLYKPVSAVRNNFNQLSPDMAEAQLMCQKPSTSGLVYPRFDGMSNVISLQDCFLRLTGEVPHNTSHDFLRDMLVNLGITFIGGADWGYTDYTSLVVLAIIPNGEVWLVDSFIQNKLELDDIVKYIKELNSMWGVDKWYVDQAYPAYIATLKRNGLRCPEFKKVVADGIAAIQSRIVDSGNTRRFFILDIPKHKHYIDSFGEYKWQIDRKGDVIEGEPYHDSDGYSDALDSLRYPFQNIFAKGGKIMFTYPLAVKENVKLNGVKEAVAKANTNIMVNKIKELAPNYQNEKKEDTAPTKKKVLWM